MAFVDVAKVTSLLEKYQLDGLLVVEPENFAYFSGVSASPVSIWRRAGPAAIVVTANAELTFIVPDVREEAMRRAHPDATILSHPIWIEQIAVDPLAGGTGTEMIARSTANRQLTRPATYDPDRVHALLHTALGEAGLLGKRLGVELEFAPTLDVDRLRGELADTTLVNSSPLIRELRLFKTPGEIDLHRRGVHITEAGFMQALEGINCRTRALDVRTKYCEAANRFAREHQLIGFESAETMVNIGPSTWGTGDPLRAVAEGDLIQFDGGVVLHGARTDIGRTFSYGRATAAQQRIYNALHAGFVAGAATLLPGRRFRDVFRATLDAVHAAGIPSYTRGHVGHSIGSEIFIEEWPFFSATEERVLEPGMALAFEVPYYVDGIGSFQIENNVLITDNGHELFNELPTELVVVGR